jgi:hypothetical protein
MENTYDDIIVEDGSLVIDITKSNNSQQTIKTLKIGYKTLNMIQYGMELDLTLPAGSIKFNAAAANFLVQNALGGGLAVSIDILRDKTQLSPQAARAVGDRTVYNLKVLDNEKNVFTSLNGNAEMILPYELLPGDNPGRIRVYMVNDDGRPELIQGSRYENGNVIFTVSRLSYFMIL